MKAEVSLPVKANWTTLHGLPTGPIFAKALTLTLLHIAMVISTRKPSSCAPYHKVGDLDIAVPERVKEFAANTYHAPTVP